MLSEFSFLLVSDMAQKSALNDTPFHEKMKFEP